MTDIKTKIAGIPHRKPNLALLSVGGKVKLVPEPDNPHDPNAIMVMLPLPDGHDLHLGYIPRTDTSLVSHLTEMFIHEVVPSRKWEEVIIASYPPV